jgi:hypothetical protein
MTPFVVAVWLGIKTVPYPVYFHMTVEPDNRRCYLKKSEVLEETKSCKDVSIRVVTPSDEGKRVQGKVELVCKPLKNGVEINFKCSL